MKLSRIECQRHRISGVYRCAQCEDEQEIEDLKARVEELLALLRAEQQANTALRQAIADLSAKYLGRRL